MAQVLAAVLSCDPCSHLALRDISVRVHRHAMTVRVTSQPSVKTKLCYTDGGSMLGDLFPSMFGKENLHHHHCGN